MVTPSLREIIESYNPNAPLKQASTIPASWYTDQLLYQLEMRTVFARYWQLACRLDQLSKPGQYVTSEIAGEPIVLVRGNDNLLRGFFNVCRHHAAAVMTEPEGTANQLRCPYHGWTYSLAGELKGTPDFAGVCDFDRSANSLVPVAVDVWEQWVFVRVEGNDTLESFLGANLIGQMRPLKFASLQWLERRHYAFDCNWKVFVDNYLDGGYHVPHLHKGLDSVLDYSNYSIENGKHFCLQWSPLVSEGAEEQTGAVRKGERALYYWARLYAGQLQRGDPYTALRRCVVILITNFFELASRRFHSSFRVQEQHDAELLTNHLELHLLELPKLRGALDKNDEPSLAAWGRFLTANADDERPGCCKRARLAR